MSRRHRSGDAQLRLPFIPEIPCDVERIETHPDGSVERWRPIEGFPGYEISDRGRCLSRKHRSPRFLKPDANQTGHLRYGLKNLGERQRAISAHSLVLRAFIGPRPPGKICRHIDDDPANNRLDNLYWGTHVENSADIVRNGNRNTGKRGQRKPILFFDPFIPWEAVVPWEHWKETADYRAYEVSSWGRVRTYRWRGSRPGDPPRLMALKRGRRGHLRVGLIDATGKQRMVYVHLLMMRAFNPKPADGLECRHVDGNKDNNHASNLKWGSRNENARDKILHGTSNTGERSWTAKLTEADIPVIRRRLAAGESSGEIARDYPVSARMICHIRRREAWGHID